MATVTTTTTAFFVLLFFMLMAAMTNAAPERAPEKLRLGCISACQATCSELPSTWEKIACYAGCDLLCAEECVDSFGILCKGFQRARKLMGPTNMNAFKARLISNNNYGGEGKDGVAAAADTNAVKTQP